MLTSSKSHVVVATMSVQRLTSMVAVRVFLASCVCLVVSAQYENVAEGKRCNMSSNFNEDGFQTSCSAAINGNTRTAYSQSNCIHTAVDDGHASWTVDLGEQYTINKIVIYGRSAFRERMASCVVSIDGEQIYQVSNRYSTDITVTANLPRTGRHVTISRDGMLNICEVQVLVCSNGTYGSDCSHQCGAGCQSGRCDALRGDCPCRPGWRPGTCHQACEQYEFGQDCNGTCSDMCHGNHMDDRECNIETGRCLSGCVRGYHGAQCDQRCSVHCPDSCDQDSGACIGGCADGYFGQLCNIACSKLCAAVDSGAVCDNMTGHCYNGCHEGAYGERCDQLCGAHCEGHCDRDTGHCPACAVGYYGEGCYNTCGAGCVDGDCDDTSGNCTCLPGWALDTCHDCQAGHYGGQCDRQCGHCRGTAACDRTTGHCHTCLPGWQPPSCQQACAPGRWGDNCTDHCGHCADGGLCHTVTGRCLNCETGYHPPLCRTPCPHGSYGQDCSSMCGRCGDSNTCDKVTGICDTCQAGYLLPYCTVETASQSVAWTSASRLPNNVIIPTCPAQDVTLDWNYAIQDPSEQVVMMEWRFKPEGGQEVLLATKVRDLFFPSPTSTNIHYLPNAGLRLQHVHTGDGGTYSVHVNLNAQGSMVTNSQSAQVLVSNDPVTVDGGLHVQMAPGFVFLSSTQQYHVLLSCGVFRSVWSPWVNVLWKVQSKNETVNSTFQRDGQFYLALSNPLTTDNYTCSLDPASPASQCVQPSSPIATGVSVHVDAKVATIHLLNGQLAAVKEEIGLLKENYTVLSEENGLLKGNITQLREQYAVLSEEYTMLSENYTAMSGEYAMTRENNTALREECTLMSENYTLLRGEYAVLREEHTVMWDNYTAMREEYTIMRENCTSMKEA